MKRIFIHLIAYIIYFQVSSSLAMSADFILLENDEVFEVCYSQSFYDPSVSPPPKEGGVLPEIHLPTPKDPRDKDYLGLSHAKDTFKIPEIKARVVIIEIFSMYCPYCQAEAPRVNELYKTIEDDPDLRNKIKLIGIGARNSSYEIGVFKKRYQVPFPLFPDRSSVHHKALGKVKTPYFIGVKMSDDATHQVFYSKVGRFQSIEQFLKILREVTESDTTR